MKEDGGTAFPNTAAELNDGGMVWPGEYGVGGMSLRDYFAIHCDQPGEAEIATAAGFTLSKGLVWETKDESIGTFTEWWRNIPQAERFILYSKVRYALADAMLKERLK